MLSRLFVGAVVGASVAVSWPSHTQHVHAQLKTQVERYTPPAWARQLPGTPTHRVRLAHLPTPIVEVSSLPGIDLQSLQCRLLVKRDDLTGAELSGNKVRKLEFLLADAVHQGYDSVITIGGEQSNHCRATACAARQLGLQPHLVLRTCTDVNAHEWLNGNLMWTRMLETQLWLVSPQRYVAEGSDALVKRLAQRLHEETGARAYEVGVGGSNWLGSWGYLEAVEETLQQLRERKLEVHDVVVACGSGGTTTGLGLGVRLSGWGAKVHAFGVCPDDFYHEIDEGILPKELGVSSRELVELEDVTNKGYAVSTPEELEFLRDVAKQTGLVFDPVYSGKALLGLVAKMRREPESFRGRTVLFFHTGGAYGLASKEAQLAEVLPKESVIHTDL